MRLSELVIIYLAVAAPFGAAHLMRQRVGGATRARACAKGAGAALFWPAWLALRLARGARTDHGNGDRRQSLDTSLVDGTKRETVGALRRAEDEFCASGTGVSEEARHRFFAAREYAERYVGLALACDGERAEEAPSEREMELCRIAGRAGDDLLIAGRCVHRRNVTRLLAHRERARAEFESALLKLCSEAGGTTPSGALTQALAASLDGARRLFSILGDEEAAERVSTLSATVGDGRAEFETASPVRADASGLTKGERSCTTQAAHTAFANPAPSTTTLTRG
jgi:hypothetical protein